MTKKATKVLLKTDKKPMYQILRETFLFAAIRQILISMEIVSKIT